MLFDDTKQCVIIDPGCYDKDEERELQGFIDQNGLKPVMLLQTHCHIDHVLGNQFIFDTYGLKPICHQLEVPLLEGVPEYGRLFGMEVTPSPKPERLIHAGDEISFGETTLKALFTPGHSPGSVSLYCQKDGFVIAGDVLFHESIGRTDLPGGSFPVLEKSIREQLYTLPAETTVWPGHGPETTIGYEMKYNPFVK